MWLAWLGGMGLATATIEMVSPEAHRERLHDLLKATRTVMVLSNGCGERGERIVGQAMRLLHTGDDTTMYVAGRLDAERRNELARAPRVAVVVQGGCAAMFDAEAAILRDRVLIDQLAMAEGRIDPSCVILALSPISGSYWDGSERHMYLYRLSARAESDLSDGVPVGV